VPGAGGDLLVSMGTMAGEVPGAGMAVVPTYTVVAGLVPVTFTPKRLLYTGLLTPLPHLGGAQTATRPAPPGAVAVRVLPLLAPPTVATAGLLLEIVTGAPSVTTPFVSIISA